MRQTSTYKLQVACFHARQTASILDPHSLLRSHVYGLSHQLHACGSTQGGNQQKGLKHERTRVAAPQTKKKHDAKSVSTNRSDTHAEASPSTGKNSCFCCFDGETLLLWHRGVSAYLLTQTLAYKDGWLHGRVRNTAPSNARSRHNSDKYGCEDVLLCAVPLAVLLTETKAQSGFTTWFL